VLLAKRYDPWKNVDPADRGDMARARRFSTYAVGSLRNAMIRALYKESLMGVSGHGQDTVQLYAYLKHESREFESAQLDTLISVLSFHKIHRRLPGRGELEEFEQRHESAALSANMRKYLAHMLETYKPLSFDYEHDMQLTKPIDDEGVRMFAVSEANSVAGDSDTVGASEAKIAKEYIRKQLDLLPVKMRRVLEYRFGFHGEEYTLQQTGDRLGITRERVRQIEDQALGRLRNPKIRRMLRDFLA
jgi:RNA polymerase sigma factor (sigma-70 family)